MFEWCTNRSCKVSVFLFALCWFEICRIMFVSNRMATTTSTQSSSSLFTTIPQEAQVLQNMLQQLLPSSFPLGQEREETSRIKPAATIAYALSITDCPKRHQQQAYKMIDMVAVLKHSIYLTSVRNSNSTSRYDYDLIAFVHPDAEDCAPYLSALDFKVQMKETPVNVSTINNTAFVKRVTSKGSGCCREKEFLKLYAYTLTQYPLVVHLDADTLILKPLDDLFDVMLASYHQNNNTTNTNDTMKRIIPGSMWNRTLTEHPINSMFTRDYGMLMKPRESVLKVGMQGGFWILRPNVSVFHEYVHLIQHSDFVPMAGWGGTKLSFGGYYGAAQIQGLVTYYYGHFYPTQFVELDRCLYNQMVDTPRKISWHNRKPVSLCLTGENNSTCRNCRQTPVKDIVTAHFTNCQKPIVCNTPNQPNKQNDPPLCYELHREWHRVRYLLEQQQQQASASRRALSQQQLQQQEHDDGKMQNSSVRISGQGRQQQQQSFATATTKNMTNYYYGHCQPLKFGGYRYVPLFSQQQQQ